jgi:molecular chaperone GrpE
VTDASPGDAAAADEVFEPESGADSLSEAPPTDIQAIDLGIDLADDPFESRQQLITALMVTRQEAGEYLETMHRIAAEFDNFRKRVERDRVELIQRAAQRLITDMLPTLDSFDAALAFEPQTPAEEKILDGMRSTRAQLLDLLQAEGLEPIAAENTPFDPAVHEAVSGPSLQGEGELMVAGELRRGYTLNGLVLRAALVAVELGEEQDG